jgi:hypothetical protein
MAFECHLLALFHRREHSIGTEAVSGQAALNADAVPRAKMTHQRHVWLTSRQSGTTL